jgi:dCMP deaminase
MEKYKNITKEDIKFLRLVDKLEPTSTCLRANVACALVKGGKVLVKGTNNHHKETNCKRLGCIRDRQHVKSGTHREICYGLCAEQWCLAQAAKKGIKTQGSTAYTTKHPCRVCESLLTEAGIKRVVYQDGYPEILPSFNLFDKRRIKVELGPNTDARSKKVPKATTI